jgi:hypothetical protein
VFELDQKRRDELIEQWARRIVEGGLAAPAVFLLEAHKPLAGIGAQLLLAFAPLIGSLVRLNVGELAAFVRRPDNLDLLLARIETLEAQRAEGEDAQRERERG